MRVPSRIVPAWQDVGLHFGLHFCLRARGTGSIFARLGARLLLWSLVPWGLSLLPVLRPGVPLAPSVAFLIGFVPL